MLGNVAIVVLAPKNCCDDEVGQQQLASHITDDYMLLCNLFHRGCTKTLCYINTSKDRLVWLRWQLESCLSQGRNTATMGRYLRQYRKPGDLGRWEWRLRW